MTRHREPVDPRTPAPLAGARRRSAAGRGAAPLRARRRAIAGGPHHRRPRARLRRRRSHGVPRHPLRRRHRRRAVSCRRVAPAPWRGVVEAREFGAASPQPGIGAQSIRGLPVPQRDCAAREGVEAAARHRLHPWRRLFDGLGLEPAVRRRQSLPTRRCGGGHAQPPAQPVRLSLPAGISGLRKRRAARPGAGADTGCATTSGRSAAIRAASPC